MLTIPPPLTSKELAKFIYLLVGCERRDFPAFAPYGLGLAARSRESGPRTAANIRNGLP